MTKNDRMWRSLSEFQGTPEFEDLLSKEFPQVEAGEPGSFTRRRFVQLMGASFALAGATACIRWEKESIMPFARRPQGLEPGDLTNYRSGMNLGGSMVPVEVTCFDNRPYKIEPHTTHPYGQGGSDTYAQASILGLFDPDRSQTFAEGKRGSSGDKFDAFMRSHFTALRKTGGQGVRFLSGADDSPTMDALKAKVQASLPKSKWVEFESLSRDNAREGAQMAFGTPHRTIYNLDQARVIVALDADLFGSDPARLQLSKDWAKGRDPESGEMNRLYVIESRYSNTGASADNRLALRSEQIGPFLEALEGMVNAQMAQQNQVQMQGFLNTDKVKKWLAALAADLVKFRGQSAVTVGYTQAPEVHAIAHRLNRTLGNKKAVQYAKESKARPSHFAGLEELTKEMAAGQVDTLVILGSNPVYSAPGHLNFADALGKVKNSIHVGLYQDETAKACAWHAPEKHYLETWSTGRTWDGTITIAQPLLTPLYKSTSISHAVRMVLGDFVTTDRDMVKSYIIDVLARRASAKAKFQKREEIAAEENKRRDEEEDQKAIDEAGAAAFAAVVSGYKHAEATMTSTVVPEGADPELVSAKKAMGARRAHKGYLEIIEKGFIPNTAFTRVQPAVQSFKGKSFPARAFQAEVGADAVEVTFFDDGKVFDGRFANNGWLQETPEFASKLTWDNAAYMSPNTAKMIGGVVDGDMVSIATPEGTIEVAAYIMPGQATGSLSVAVGYGRKMAGVVGGYDTKGIDQVGFDVQPLRTAAEPYIRAAKASKTGGTYELASTQEHNLIDNAAQQERLERASILMREASLPAYQKDPKMIQAMDHHPPLLSLFDDVVYTAENQWGKAVDLGKCTGCNACVVACTSENNVPVVGKKQVLVGREMHWIRLDRYFKGDNVEEATMMAQPVACVHCENAPCEQVCPVGATMHSPEGMNDMVYNRCIGTRYCANNCPYKVRRFNFHNYHQDLKEEENKVKTMAFNPDVTVRFRGVMEKCSYCVQRIKAAQRKAKIEKTKVRDGDVITACQAACPTDAIAFGDLADNNSRVAKLKRLQRNYVMLEELNIRPRTSYLAKINNPNPALSEV